VIQFPDARPVFGENSPEARVYAYVQEMLRALGTQLHTVSLGSVADALGWTHDLDKRKAIVRALDQLAFGEASVLERHFLLWSDHPDPEVLESPISQISDLEMRRALETNLLTLSETGEQISDFMNRISVEYVLRDDVRALLQDGE
jgi:hypothetical protein